MADPPSPKRQKTGNFQVPPQQSHAVAASQPDAEPLHSPPAASYSPYHHGPTQYVPPAPPYPSYGYGQVYGPGPFQLTHHHPSAGHLPTLPSSYIQSGHPVSFACYSPYGPHQFLPILSPAPPVPVPLPPISMVTATQDNDEALARELQAQFDQEEQQILNDTTLAQNLSAEEQAELWRNGTPPKKHKLDYPTESDSDDTMQGYEARSKRKKTTPVGSGPKETVEVPPVVDLLAVPDTSGKSLNLLRCGLCGSRFFPSADSFKQLVTSWLFGPETLTCGLVCKQCNVATCMSCGDTKPQVTQAQEVLTSAKLALQAFQMNVPDTHLQAKLNFCCVNACTDMIRMLLLHFDFCRESLKTSGTNKPEARPSTRRSRKSVTSTLPNGIGYGSSAPGGGQHMDWVEHGFPNAGTYLHHTHTHHHPPPPPPSHAFHGPGYVLGYPSHLVEGAPKVTAPYNSNHANPKNATHSSHLEKLSVLQKQVIDKIKGTKKKQNEDITMPGKGDLEWTEASMDEEPIVVSRHSLPKASANADIPKANHPPPPLLLSNPNIPPPLAAHWHPGHVLKHQIVKPPSNTNSPANYSHGHHLRSSNGPQFKAALKEKIAAAGAYVEAQSGFQLGPFSSALNAGHSPTTWSGHPIAPGPAPASFEDVEKDMAAIMSTKAPFDGVVISAVDDTFLSDEEGSEYLSDYDADMQVMYRGRYKPEAEPTKSQLDLMELDRIMQRTLELMTRLFASAFDEDNSGCYDGLGLSNVIASSLILDGVAEVLRNDSLEDALKRRDLYTAALTFTMDLAAHSQTQALVTGVRRPKIRSEILFPPNGKEKLGNDEERPSLKACMSNLAKQSRVLSKNSTQAQRGHDTTEDMIRFCKLVSSIDGLLSTVEPQHVMNASAPTGSTELASQDRWIEYQKVNAFADAPDDTFFATHHFALQARQETTSSRHGRMAKLLSERATLSTSLPAGIFVRFAENRPDLIKALIIGPKGTPYENGLFEFDFYCPPSYPSEPPKCHFMTTGGGTTHFNPNLYQTGKVCLSLLNTWEGEPWTPGRSTILQVLVSIQAMILCEDPWYNEPGRGRADSQSQAYNKSLRPLTVNIAMIDWFVKELEAAGEDVSQYRAKATKSAARRSRMHAPAAATREPAKESVWTAVTREYARMNGEGIKQTVLEWIDSATPEVSKHVLEVLDSLIDRVARLKD